MTVLIVRHAAVRLGIELASVQEVLRMVAPRTLPGAAPRAIGMLDLRGETFPMLDLETRLPAGAAPPGVEHALVVLRTPRTSVALVVTAIDEIGELAPGSFRASAALLPRGVPVAGIAHTEAGDRLPILDADALLDGDGEAMALSEAMRRLEGAPAP